MQLCALTTVLTTGLASAARPESPRHLLSLPVVFGLGMVAGVIAVALARGWLRLRPHGSGRAVGQPGPRPAQLAQPVSAPVAVAPARQPEAAGDPEPADTTEPLPACDPVPMPGEISAVRALLPNLENFRVTLVTGPAELTGRLLSTAAAELAAGAIGPCDLVLAGFACPPSEQPSGQAGDRVIRCDDLAAALDLIAARTVLTRRELAAGAGAAAQNWLLTVLVSRFAPAPGELSMLIDLLNEPGRATALLPSAQLPSAQLPSDGQPQGPTAMLVLSRTAGPSARLVAELVTRPVAEPGPSLDSQDEDPGHACDEAVSLRIGVLGQLTINGQPGALLPAQTQLIVALALAGAGGRVPNRQLCELLGADSDHPKPADSLRQLIARTRRQLGRAGDGHEWIEHLGHGQYALHKDSRLDWHEFEALTDQGIGAGDAGLLATALGMIRGQPFTGCYYWWLDIELVEAVSAKIVAAASVLAELALARRDPTAAARAARIGLVADGTAEQLWRLLMRAEHAAGNLAGVREAWARCADAVREIAADGQPEPATAAIYHEFLSR